QAQQALFHRRFTQPGNAVLARRTRFLQLTHQDADRFVVAGVLKHQIFEILRHKNVIGQNRFDRFGNLRSLLVETLNDELALCRVGVVPPQQYSEAVEPLLEVVAQGAFKLLVQLSVLGALGTPFLCLHFGTGEDEQVTIQEGIGATFTRQQETHRVAPLLQVVFEDRKSTRLNSSHVKISYAV